MSRSRVACIGLRPAAVRRALVYVLNNARRHGLRLAQGLDHFASGWWFDGWKEKIRTRDVPAARPVAEAQTWLLRGGWRRGGGRKGLIGLEEVPGG